MELLDIKIGQLGPQSFVENCLNVICERLHRALDFVQGTLNCPVLWHIESDTIWLIRGKMAALVINRSTGEFLVFETNDCSYVNPHEVQLGDDRGITVQELIDAVPELTLREIVAGIVEIERMLQEYATAFIELELRLRKEQWLAIATKTN